MSVLDFVSSGGKAIVSGDLGQADKKEVQNIVKVFVEKLDIYERSLSAISGHLKVKDCNQLFVAKDTMHYHLVFGNDFGAKTINYRDLTSHGRVELKTIVANLREEDLKVVWAFSVPANIPLVENEPYIDDGVRDYIANLVKAENIPTEGRKANAIIPSKDIKDGLARFEKGRPSGFGTAFIMEVGKGVKHQALIHAIKDTLDRHDIIGLCVGDKKFMKDNFLNAKVYMHACDYGVVLFDPLLEGDINPAVSLEAGYMMGLGKEVLFLKDKTLEPNPLDMLADNYKNYDAKNIGFSVQATLKDWLAEQGLLI